MDTLHFLNVEKRRAAVGKALKTEHEQTGGLEALTDS
jgi:hypothetical protein